MKFKTPFQKRREGPKTKIVEKFLLFPKIIDGNFCWLETIKYEQKLGVWQMGPAFGVWYIWETTKLID